MLGKESALAEDAVNEKGEVGDGLPGGLVVWIFVAVEILTFAAFFVAFADAYADEPRVFLDAQALLHPLRGAINTGVLLTGSWLVARATVAPATASRWLFAAGVSGVVFVAIKVSEYVDVFSVGITMSTNSFWFYYLFLTFMHLLHVVFGIGAMFSLSFRASRAHAAGSTKEFAPSLEAGAVYWHLVDLIWIVLFPTIYLMRAL